MNGDRLGNSIAKQRLNVIVIVDCSTSMRGERIARVNGALRDIRQELIHMQDENSNVDFYMTVITYSTEARLLKDSCACPVQDFSFTDIKAGGWSNLHLAYDKLAELLKKQSKGGIMPDFGGVAPILLLLTDGHPTKYPVKDEMQKLSALPWFRVAIRYGIAIELNDKRTMDVLHDFVGQNGDVVECYDGRLLQRIIKIIVLTASKVRSQSASVHKGEAVSAVSQVRMQVGQTLAEVDDWEW